MNFTEDILAEDYIEEMSKKDLPDSDFGIPEERKYPMPDKKHVLLAIRFFNYVEAKYEKELASNIIRKIHEFKMEDEIHVGESNRFKKYWDKENGITTKKENAQLIADAEQFIKESSKNMNIEEEILEDNNGISEDILTESEDETENKFTSQLF